MKLLIKYYSSIFCSLIRAEEIEIKSNKILVSQLKQQISIKFHIPITDIILTLKYETNNQNVINKNILITLSDEFPLFYFYIHNNTEILLEKRLKIDKNSEIFEKIKYTENKKYRHLKRLQIYNNAAINFPSKKNLAIIKESENEYTEINEIIDEKDKDKDNENNNKNYINEDNNNKIIKNNKNEQIINQAIEFIIQDKVTQFNEYIYINDFIQENIDILTNKETGWNALHYSSFYGQEKMTQNLIKLFNPSPQLINGLTFKEKYTPLHLACIKGHINVIRILLFLKDIDLNIQSEIEGTPLHIACQKNNMQIVSILVSFKADLNIRNSKKKLPIELTTDENIKKILKKAMLYKKDEEGNIITKDTELSLYVDKFFVPPKPPISIGSIEKRGFFLPIYDSIFIEVNPIVGCIKKYKLSKDYPNNFYEKTDLNLVNSCAKETSKNKEFFYFSIVSSGKETFRVKNEKSFERWVKIINEATIFCKYWKRIEKINKSAHEFLSKQKNIIEIIEENGEIKNYEEEQRKKEEEMKEKEREDALKGLNSGTSLDVKKMAKPQVNNNNNKNVNNGKNVNNKQNNMRTYLSLKTNVTIDILNDSGKKGINFDSFTIIELIYYYSYGKVYKVKLKPTIFKDNPELNNIINKNEILTLRTINKKEINRLKQLKNIQSQINIALNNTENNYLKKIIFAFQDETNIYIAEKYCLGGNLKWHINLALFEEQEAKYYIAELILAIEQIHKKDFVFKNLTSEKILINNNNHIQLINYGLIPEKSKNLEKNKNSKKNEINPYKNLQIDNKFFEIQEEYLPTEIASNLLGEDKMSDIYGIGVVLYEMVCGTKPFYSKENVTLFGDDTKKNKLMINEYFSIELKNLLNKLLTKDKIERFDNLDEVKKHIFFKNIDWNKLAKNEIVPPINLVKNRCDNWNKIGFRKKLKNEKKDYFLDFNIVTNVRNFSFLKKYVEKNNNRDNNNSNNNMNQIKENKNDYNIAEGNFINNENNKKDININVNYIDKSDNK